MSTVSVAASYRGLFAEPVLRSLWSAHAGARFSCAAFALDAAVFDLAYITGPVLAGAWLPASPRPRPWG